MSRPEVIADRADLRRAVAKLRQPGRSMGLVPTMGALHDGHLSLVDACRRACDVTVVTIFINPLQFGPAEDLDRYPRTLDADVEALAHRGVDLVFAPSENEIYRPGHDTYVEVGQCGRPLEGAHRPGHFRGVATVVLKLFQLIPADMAFFGRKDYQQLVVIRRMVEDFDLPIQIQECPIVRAADGLAVSSRNVYLSDQQRQRARSLVQGLDLAEKLVESGQRDARQIEQAVGAHVRRVGGVEPQYVALVREGTVEPVARVDGPSALAVAAVFGTTRLIDNRRLG